MMRDKWALITHSWSIKKKSQLTLLRNSSIFVTESRMHVEASGKGGSLFREDSGRLWTDAPPPPPPPLISLQQDQQQCGESGDSLVSSHFQASLCTFKPKFFTEATRPFRHDAHSLPSASLHCLPCRALVLHAASASGSKKSSPSCLAPVT